MCSEVELSHHGHLLYQKVQQISKKVTSVTTLPLEKLLVPQLVNKLLHFTQSECQLPCTQSPPLVRITNQLNLIHALTSH